MILMTYSVYRVAVATHETSSRFIKDSAMALHIYESKNISVYFIRIFPSRKNNHSFRQAYKYTYKYTQAHTCIQTHIRIHIQLMIISKKHFPRVKCKRKLGTAGGGLINFSIEY